MPEPAGPCGRPGRAPRPGPGRAAPRSAPPPPRRRRGSALGAIQTRRSRVDAQLGDRALAVVESMYLDLENAVEPGREREGHRARLRALLDLVAMDVDRLLGLRQVHPEPNLIALVVGQRLLAADRVAVGIDAQHLDGLGGAVAALVAVVALKHDEEQDRRDDHRREQPEPHTPRL